MEFDLEKMISANRVEYEEEYSRMRFVTPVEAKESDSRRKELLKKLAGRVKVSCRETKMYSGELSPGCQTCGEGSWSCLFINGICNGRCFYCPTPQKQKGEPMTNNLRFPNSRDYLDYISRFGFRGVSLSGGEPLLTFDRTLNYITKLKQRFGSSIYIWIYSNGILATADKIAQLSNAGLEEMRFDISAVDYSLDGIKLAAGHIPRVTVEIPAIPEDYQRLRDLLPVLAEVGVNHINLHQLRCTPHNLSQFLARGYVFSHGPKVVVPESELTALQLLIDADRLGGPAVNYCSYAYKYRFQALAARRRTLDVLAAPYEDVTTAGFIRTLHVKGEEGMLRQRVDELREKCVDPALYRLEKGERLLFSAKLWPLFDFSDLELHVGYYQTRVQERPSYQGRHVSIPVNRKRALTAERSRACRSRMISAGELPLFYAFFVANTAKQNGDDEKLFVHFADILEYEEIPPGLQRYF